MEEVKKSKKKNKQVKVAKVKQVEVEELDGELEEVEEKIERKKVEKTPEKKSEKEEKTEEEPKKKKGGKVFLIILLILLVLGGGGFAVKTILTRTTVTTETVKMADDARGLSNYFKEYLLDRIKAERLFSYSFRNLSNDEILSELTVLKDGFAKVSRGVNSAYKNSEYKELADVMESDSTLYLAAVRELRTVMTGAYDNDGDRQLAFMRKVEETTKDLRSALYMSSSAFTEDVSGLSSKGVILFSGVALAEVGGGVMNILVGDLATPVVAVTTDDMDKTIKSIDAKGLYGYVGSRVVKLGDGLSATLDEGWVKNIKAEVKTSEAILTTTKISLVMKNVWGMDEELKGQGIKGLVNTEKKAMEEQLNEVVSRIEGKK
ncbi:hypothetical protein IIZ77_02785 [Candidatus Saccharibacteria bacterium]|nr:hypothetical protein [Candidatus Saccharibacteria bacterium]